MKWNIDWILRKLYFYLPQIISFIFGIFLALLGGLYKVFFKIFFFILPFFNPLYPLFSAILVFILDVLLFLFLSIPLFLFFEFVKPTFLKFFNFLLSNVVFYNLFKNFLKSTNFLKNNFFFFVGSLWGFFLFFFKKLIDFLFFGIFMKRVFLKKLLHRFLINLVRFFLVYLLFYVNLWGTIFNLFFSSYNENFVWWNFSSLSGYMYIFITFLNVDNIIMYLYIFFFDVGPVKTFFVNSSWENTLVFGLKWVDYYERFKLYDLNFCFFKYILDNFIHNLDISNITNTNLLVLEYKSVPLFFYFGSLFFSTVIFSWLFFSYLGLYGLFKLNIITLFLFWVSLLFSAKSILIFNKVFLIKLCSWVFLSTNVKIDFYFLIDTISFSFMLLTTTIAFFVYIYAFSYFRYEPLVDRFLLFILSFVISMIFLVTSGNTIMLFLGWELIGLTSFFLINFWTTKVATLKSAFKAFNFNKISDFFMFMFLVSTYTTYYTFDILSLNQQIYKYEYTSMYLFGVQVNFIEFVSLMIIGAAFIKSAQIGGHAWLPDSMEAPVPASSLIHSATLVSAGVYLILRFNFIFDMTQYSKFIIPVIGSLTAAYGGVCAAFQSDIKKTLAYSTISHCGFLMVLCSTEMNEFTILYLYVHGFFKAGVFMCVGNVLRITRGYQDTRRMGGLLKYLPFEYFCSTVGLLNLAGLPFTFGFFIKHLLLISLDSHIYVYLFVVFNSLLGAFSGLFYSYRIINYTFGDFKKGNKLLYLNTNRINFNSKFYTNSSTASTLSIFCLFVLSYIITYYLFIYFLSGSFLFSDYMNTTLLTNYYSTINCFGGYLLNFSYINTIVIIIFTSLYLSKSRKILYTSSLYDILISILSLSLFLFLFYNFL